jgi:hypothetical protein
LRLRGLYAIDDYVFGSGFPSEKKLRKLNELGFGAILTLTNNGLPSSWLIGFKEYKHIHLLRKTIKSNLEDAVDFIERQVQNQTPILVHCRLGRDRTYAVAAAYMMKKEGISSREAIKRIRCVKPSALRRLDYLNGALKELEYPTVESK